MKERKGKERRREITVVNEGGESGRICRVKGCRISKYVSE